MKFSEIKELEQKGLISAPQAELICSQYGLREGKKDYLMRLLAFLGGCLILTGLILIISANWTEIPSLVKTVSGIVIMLGLWAGGLWMKFKSSFPKMGEGLCFAGTGMWLANIALYSQIYQVSSSPFEGTLLFFLGIVWIPFILKLKSVFFVVLATTIPLLMTYLSEECAGSAVTYWLALLLSLAWIVLGVFFSQCKKGGLLSSYARMTLFNGFLFFFIMSASSRMLMESRFFREDWGVLPFWMAGGGVILLLLWGLALWDRASFVRGRKDSRVLTLPLVVALSALPICVLGWHGMDFLSREYAQEFFSEIMTKNFFSALSFGIALVAMFAGGTLSRVWLINLSVGALVLSVFIFVCDLVGQYGMPGFILVFVGLIFLALSVLIEKQRRKLVAKARTSHIN